MGKIRAKQRLSAIILIFALTLFAGSAFAFVSGSPISLDGTAHVSASLGMAITGTSGFSSHNVQAHYNIGSPSFGDSGDGVDVSHNAVFTQPGQYFVWHFDVTNVGTIPTRLVEIKHINFDFKLCAGLQEIFGNDPEQIGFSAYVLNEQELVGSLFSPLESKTLKLLLQWTPNLYHLDGYDMLYGILPGDARFEVSMHTEIMYEPVFY